MTTDTEAGPPALPDAGRIAAIAEAVVDATRAAGKLVAERFGGTLEVSWKSAQGYDLVTDVDRASQRLIAGIMAERCPDHMLLGEEEAPENEPPAADFVWAVDPIDGTTNFVNGSPMHAVSVAVLYRGIPIAGAIWVPWPSEPGFALIHAHTGGGTWLDGKRLTIEEPKDDGAPVVGRLSAVPGSLSSMYDLNKPLRGCIGEPRVTGSTAYEMLMVTRGSMQLALSGFASTWDFAAGLVLVREAGGVTRTLNREGRFVDFPGWSHGYANDAATSQRLRKWKGPMLSAHPKTVDFVTANLRLRQPSIWDRMLRTFRT